MKKAIQRIKAIPPLYSSHTKSPIDADLAREYLRRVALMAKSLPGWDGGPFFNTSEVTANDLDPQVITEIDAAVTADTQPNGYVRRLCIDYIKWQAYVEVADPVACLYPDIFEPLLRLFERGQSFGIRHGELVVGSFAIPLTAWLESSEMPALDLDEKNDRLH